MMYGKKIQAQIKILSAALSTIDLIALTEKNLNLHFF
jgi:hypothetical protein